MGFIGGRSISIAFFMCIVFVLFGSINVEAEKEIPTTKFGQNVGGPTMTFLYWYSIMESTLKINTLLIINPFKIPKLFLWLSQGFRRLCPYISREISPNYSDGWQL